MQSVAVAFDDLVLFCHLFLDGRIVRCKSISAFRRFDQKESFTFSYLQAVDHFFRQHNAERVPEFTDFEYSHGFPFAP
jgi:hypothetical protein